MVPANTLVADGFFHRQALARDRCLVNGRTTGDHVAVQANPFARANPYPRTEGDDFYVLRLPAAIGLLHGGLFRGHLHQATDGVARPIEGFGFDQLGHGEQEHHHRRFRPLADQHGAGHGDAHQGIDVQIAVLQGDPTFL